MTEQKKTVLPDRVGYGNQSVTGKIRSLFFGGLTGFILSIPLLLVSSVIFALSGIPDGLIPLFLWTAVVVSAFAAGFTALRMIKSEGLVNGLIAGVILFLFHAAAIALFGDGGISQCLIYGAVELPCAALGGVISVNLKKF